MSRRFAIAIFCAWCATAPAAAQPISQSMAQCAGLADAMSRMVSAPEKRDRLERLMDIWTSAALAQAGAEGRSDGPVWVAGHSAQMREKWTEKGPVRMLTSQEFRDWTQYCGSLARDRGLDTLAAR